MLRRVGNCPVTWQKKNEDHRSEKCIGEPEAAPYPKGKDSAGRRNQGHGRIRPRRIKAAAEKSSLYSRAEKTDRANGERFLDTVAIEPSLGNGEFGSHVADGSENQKENAGGLR